MRKFAVILTLFALILSLPGCGRLLKGDYASSRDHAGPQEEDGDGADPTFEAANYAQLLEAVESLISQGAERGVIRAPGYTGKLESDLADACREASTNTVLGAYCVYFINYSLNRLVSTYEASVSILYRHTTQEAAGIPVCGGAEALEELLVECLSSRAESLTVKAESGALSGEAVERCVENAYYENPVSILYMPSYTLTSYPEEGEERILELTFTYPYATPTVEQRRRNLERKAEEIAAGVPEGTAAERIGYLADYFRENVEYDGTVDTSDAQARRYSAMTAYGALSQGKAAGEGYAMGLKVLCDELGMECRVIRGRYNNMDHAWNLVRMDNGELYHVDMTVYDPAAAPIRNDDQQHYAGYWWDAALYPWCSGPSLYGPEFDPPAEDPGPLSPPAAWFTADSAARRGR